MSNERTVIKKFVLSAPDQPTEEPWCIEVQPYPMRWLDASRKEKWASKRVLKQVARQMVRQGIAGQETFRMAVWAGFTEFEAAYIARLIKTGRYK